MVHFATEDTQRGSAPATISRQEGLGEEEKAAQKQEVKAWAKQQLKVLKAVQEKEEQRQREDTAAQCDIEAADRVNALKVRPGAGQASGGGGFGDNLRFSHFRFKLLAILWLLGGLSL